VRKVPVGTSLSLGIDPTEIASQHLHHPALIDIISSTLSPGQIALPPPNQSLPPLQQTIQSGIITPPADIPIIPDMTNMPGGVPRSGNPFIVESFRDLYNGPIKASSNAQPNIPFTGDNGELLNFPAREFDFVGRYADLLNRIPLAATIYALLDFFLINAEEDVAIAELLDDEEGAEIMDVEGSVVKTRFVGLFVMVLATIVLSTLVYHPVPFNELRY
jgi:hypothetical protein